jgi:hypothetical protein
MKRNDMRIAGMCLIMLLAILGSGCAGGGGRVEKEQPALIGLIKSDTNDELNIVNWKVDGTYGDPKLGSFDWELKENNSRSVWSGIAEKSDKVPDAVGVYYVDINKNDEIDIGDIFRVKAPEDGDFTLYWTQRSTGNPGRYDSHY